MASPREQKLNRLNYLIRELPLLDPFEEEPGGISFQNYLNEINRLYAELGDDVIDSNAT